MALAVGMALSVCGVVMQAIVQNPRAENKMMSAERCAQIIVNGVVKRKREIVMTLVEGKISVFLSKWFPSLLDKLAYSHMAKEPDSPFK